MPKSKLSREAAARVVLAMFCRVVKDLPHCAIGRLSSNEPDATGFIIIAAPGNRKVAEIKIWKCVTELHVSGLLLEDTAPFWSYEGFSLENTTDGIQSREQDLLFACTRATPNLWLTILD